MVMTEGQSSGRIKTRRCVRQGCPLSPLIFNLGVEPLAIAIQANRVIGGVWFWGSELKIFYADDVLCYLRNPLRL